MSIYKLITLFPLIALPGHEHVQTPDTDPDVDVEKSQQETEQKIQVEFYVWSPKIYISCIFFIIISY